MGFSTQSPRTSSEKKIRKLQEKESLFTRGHYQQNKTFATTKSLHRLGTGELLASTIWIATSDPKRQNKALGARQRTILAMQNPIIPAN
jgi:hypothetical protein